MLPDQNTLVSIAPIVSAASDMLTALLVLVSLVIATWQIRRVRHIQREATARSIFNDYLTQAFEHPVLAYPERFRERFDYETQQIDSKPENFEQYEWFVSTTLFAMREILDIHPKDRYWLETARRQIEYHFEYLDWCRRPNVRRDYINLSGDKVNKIIEKVLSGPKPKSSIS